MLSQVEQEFQEYDDGRQWIEVYKVRIVCLVFPPTLTGSRLDHVTTRF